MKALLAVTLCTPLIAAACNSKGEPIQGIDAQGSGSVDAAPPSTVPLVVASSLGVVSWNDSAGIVADVAPDVTLTNGGLDTGASAVAVAADRLYVGQLAQPGGLAANTMVAFSGAHSLTAATMPTARVGLTAGASRLRVDGQDDLWIAYNNGEPQIDRFAGASTIAGSATASATYTHPNKQLPAFAFEPVSNRLFAGQISNAGVLAWDSATTRSGSPTFDFTLAAGAFWAMAVDPDHDRLYAGGQYADAKYGIAIWPNASALGAAAQPITLMLASSQNTFIADVVIRDDVLAVADRDQDMIAIYTHASAITTDRAPDFMITSPQLSKPSRLAIDADGRLFVVGADGVVIFKSIATAPTFVAKLTTGVGVPADLALVE